MAEIMTREEKGEVENGEKEDRIGELPLPASQSSSSSSPTPFSCIEQGLSSISLGSGGRLVGLLKIRFEADVCFDKLQTNVIFIIWVEVILLSQVGRLPVSPTSNRSRSETSTLGISMLPTLAKFDVDPQSKKKVLQSMAKSWRAFKNLLTRDYIYRFQYMPELLQHPPEVYKKYIDQSTWDEFVNQRLSNSFKKEAIPPVAIEDRAVMWLKGRETKDGVIVDDEIKEVAEKMATIRSQVEDGSVVIEGSSDILSMALGSSESAGHVRGIGFGVTPTAYFDLPRRGSKRYIKELESRLQEEREKRKNAEQMLIRSKRLLRKSEGPNFLG
ncbi:hypothetical protein LguiA_005216 [Lonicera macranthoides]